MPLIAVKPAGTGLTTVPGVRVDGRDQPVLRDPLSDPKRAVSFLVEILPDHRCQQCSGLPDGHRQLPAIQDPEDRASVFGERVDQRLPRPRVLVITDWFPRARVIVITRQHASQFGLECLVTRTEDPTDR